MDDIAESIEPGGNNTALNDIQRRGMIIYGLSEQDVRSPNFGERTLKLMRDLVKSAIKTKELTFNLKKASQIVKELDEVKLQGIELGLDINQVHTQNFGKHTLNAIERLLPTKRRQPLFPNNDLPINARASSVQEAFDMVKGLNPDQIQGRLRHGLTRENVLDKNYSKRTLETVETLHSKNPAADADYLNTAVSELSSKQNIGLINLGLRLDQVQHSYFINSENVLAEVADSFENEGREFNIPLENEEDRERIREIFDEKYNSFETDQNQDVESTTSDRQKTENDIVAATIAVTGVASISTEAQESNEGIATQSFGAFLTAQNSQPSSSYTNNDNSSDDRKLAAKEHATPITPENEKPKKKPRIK